MNCAPHDLKDLYFDDLSATESRAVREHLSQCAECAMEWEQLREVGIRLSALPEEEIPRRIAFVSDKIFEPSPVARWWQTFWMTGWHVGAMSAFVLAGAIVFHAYHQPVQIIREQVIAEAPTEAKADAGVTQAQIDRAVAQAVRTSEARYNAQLEKAVATNKVQIREYMERTQETLEAMDRRSRVFTVASNRSLESGQ